MPAGPKPKASDAPLSSHGLPKADPERACAWIEKFCIVPKGHGAGKPLHLREWQREIVSGVFGEHMPRLALLSLPRGSGKSTLLAAMGLYSFIGQGTLGASVACAAVDERQARIVFQTAVRYVQMNPQLSKRIQVFQDRLYHPKTGSEMRVYPADPKSLEGLDFSLCVLDEIGVVSFETFEVLAHAQGKRPESSLVCIGTPSPMGTDSVMWSLREAAIADPDDPSMYFKEWAAPEGSDVDDEAAWTMASPALGDFLAIDALRALKPPKTRPEVFKRARMGMWVLESDAAWIKASVWESCQEERTVAAGTDIVVGFDGSWRGDCTVLVGATVEPEPYVWPIAIWKAPKDNPDWRVPVEQVEAQIEKACKKFSVREVACDPARWQRSISVLNGRGLPMVEFPQSPIRMISATKSLYDALVDGRVSVAGDTEFAEQVSNARVKDDGFGVQVKKMAKHSDKKIDLLVAAIMAHSRAAYYVAQPVKKSKRVARSFG